MASSPLKPLLLSAFFGALVHSSARAAEAPKSPTDLLAVRAPAAKKEKSHLSTEEREIILERMRCDSEDPATCFLEPELGGPVAEEPAEVTAEAVAALLDSVLANLPAHDEEALARALAERDEEDDADLWFGAEDHHMDAPIDMYTEPVTALTSVPELHLAAINPRDFDIPLVVNERVKDWMVYFLGRGRKHYTRWLARADRYEPLIRPALAQAGLPQDLFYQSMIESGFNPYATSRAKAVGVWQFIEGTGKHYGMRIDFWVDERRDPVLATEGAIKYMRDLYKRFGAWDLASAGYNAGEGKIERAIKRYGIRDYWELSSAERTYLRPETKNYVAKIMAAAILGKYPDRYGLTKDIPDADRLSPWDFDTVHVPEATDVGAIARAAGVNEEAILAINPQLRRFCTPPGVENYAIHVPRGVAVTFAENFAKIPAEERVTYARHKVKKGEGVAKIASKYGVSKEAVLKINQIDNEKGLKVGSFIVVPVRAETGNGHIAEHVVVPGDSLESLGTRYGLTPAELLTLNRLKEPSLELGRRLKVSKTPLKDLPEASGKVASGKTGSYKVKKGDTIGKIAANHGMSLAEIKKLNGMKGDRIQVGQRLKVGADEAEESAVVADSSEAADEGTRSTHTVRAGETLGVIANKYGMSIIALKGLNDLGTDRIKAGQTLKVKGAAVTEAVASKAEGGSSAESKSHTVRNGDTLSQIAEKYGVTVANLRTWNGLDDAEIQAGDTLALVGKAGTKAKKAAEPAAKVERYKVKSGDTLGRIAQKFGVSIDTLKKWNSIRGSQIKAGQVLRVSR